MKIEFNWRDARILLLIVIVLASSEWRIKQAKDKQVVNIGVLGSVLVLPSQYAIYRIGPSEIALVGTEMDRVVVDSVPISKDSFEYFKRGATKIGTRCGLNEIEGVYEGTHTLVLYRDGKDAVTFLRVPRSVVNEAFQTLCNVHTKQ